MDTSRYNTVLRAVYGFHTIIYGYPNHMLASRRRDWRSFIHVLLGHFGGIL